MIRIQWNSCKFEFELSTKKEKWIWLGMIKMITIIKIPSGDWFDIRSNARTSPVSFHWIKWREMRWNFEQEWSELGSATWKIDLQNPFLGQRRSIKCYFIEFNHIKIMNWVRQPGKLICRTLFWVRGGQLSVISLNLIKWRVN